MVTVRKLTETEKAQGFTSIVHIRQAGRTPATGVSIVNPKTGETIGHISRTELERRRTVGGRKFRGELFVGAPPTPEVAASIRRTEEKQETRQLAEQEAKFEAGRIARGLPPVPLERKGAAKLLRQRLEEAEPEVQVREKEFLVRGIRPSGEKGELLPRKELIGRITITEPEEPIPRELIEPKKPLELFSPLARKRLGLTETPEGLLEVGVGERKRILEPRKVELRKTFIELVEKPFEKKEVVKKEVIAEIPTTAEFRTGFESQLGKGKGEFPPVGILSKGGVITSATIRPTTRKLFEPIREDIEERLQATKREIRVTKPTGIKRVQLRTQQVIGGTVLGVGEQITERPLQTASFAAISVATAGISSIPGLAVSAGIGRISVGALSTVFAGVVGFEVGTRVREKQFVEVGRIIGIRGTQAAAFVLPGIGASRIITRLTAPLPKRIKVLKAKGLETKILEAGKIEKGQASFLQEIRLEAEVSTRATRTTVKAFRRRITTPKDPAKLIKLLGRKDISIVRGLEPPLLGKKITTATLIQNVPKRTRFFNVEAEPFDISIDGKVVAQFTKTKETLLTIRKGGRIVGAKPQKVSIGIIKSKEIKGITRTIDPRQFDIITTKGEFREPVTQLLKVEFGKIKTGIELKALLGGRARIIGRTKDVASRVGDVISGGGLRVIQQQRLASKVILKVPPQEPITPELIFAPLVPSKIKRKPILAEEEFEFVPTKHIEEEILTGELSRQIRSRIGINVFKRVQSILPIIETTKARREKPIRGVISSLESLTKQLPAQLPIIDIISSQEKRQLRDVVVVSVLEQIQETKPRPRVPPIIRFPPTTPPPPLFPFFVPRLFLGDPIRRRKRPLKREFGFTPGFISSALGEFGPPPKPGQIFTGQERRFIIKGKPFLTPLPERREGIIQLVSQQLRGK